MTFPTAFQVSLAVALFALSERLVESFCIDPSSRSLPPHTFHPESILKASSFRKHTFAVTGGRSNSPTRRYISQQQPESSPPLMARRTSHSHGSARNGAVTGGVHKLQAVAEGTTLEKRATSSTRSTSVLKELHRRQLLQKQRVNKPVTRQRRKHFNQETSFYRNVLLDHEILTKAEEQELGIALKRAQSFQDRLAEMTALSEEPFPEQQRRRQAKGLGPKKYGPKQPLIPVTRSYPFGEGQDQFMTERNNNSLDDDVSDDDFDDMKNLSVYGVEQLEAEPKGNWDYHVFEADKSGSIIPTLPDTRRKDTNGRKRGRNNRKANVEYANAERRRVAGALESISDQEIDKYFGLKGGRLELREILLQGATARDTLIRNNVRLVVSVAKKWCRQQANSMGNTGPNAVYRGSWNRPSLDETIQEGILGLSKAADRFEPQRDLRFTTYATFWITSYIRNCFQTASTTGLRVPSGFHETRSRFKALVKSYHTEGKVVPPLDDLALEMGLTPKRLATIMHITKPILSTDAPIHLGATMMPGKAGNGGSDSMLIGETLEDKEVSPVEQVELSFLRQSLENAMASELVPYERDIVRLRLGLDDGVSRTVSQIVKEYGGALSPSQISLAEKRAYKKLRSPRTLSTYKLTAYLDFAGIDRAEAMMR